MIKLDFTFPQLHKVLEKNYHRVQMAIAAMAQANRGFLFDAEGAYNGRQRWAPLRIRNGMILQDRGNLRKSIAPVLPTGRPGPNGIVRFQSETVTIGTKLAYARMMNDGTTKLPGGVLRPVNAKALKIPIPKGSKFEGKTTKLRSRKPGGRLRTENVIFRKSVKIPARPFDTWTEEDANELAETLQDYLVRLFTRGRAD